MSLQTTAIVGTLSAIAILAQTNNQPGVAVEPLSTDTFSCATSGSGASYLKVCVSKHGNLTSLESAKGKEHIRVGNVNEGYTVCHYEAQNAGEPTTYFDLGKTLLGYPPEEGWQEPYKIEQPGAGKFPLTIYRKSSDGKIELVQTFNVDKVETDLTITMSVFNRSGKTLESLVIGRHADFDINGTPTNDTFLATDRSVIAADGIEQLFEQGRAISMTDITGGDAGGYQEVWKYPDWFAGIGASCGHPPFDMPETTPTPTGDYVGVVWHYFDNPFAMPPNSARTMKVVYRVQ